MNAIEGIFKIICQIIMLPFRLVGFFFKLFYTVLTFPFKIIKYIFTFGQSVDEGNSVVGRLEPDFNSRVGKWDRYCGNCGKKCSSSIIGSKKRPSKHKFKCGQCGKENIFI